MKRMRLGKCVGSAGRQLDGWTYWPEANRLTGERGFMVVAPSGARTDWFRTEVEAATEAARRAQRGERTMNDVNAMPSEPDNRGEVFAYLDVLRSTGITNVFGAAAYVADGFGISPGQASKLLADWRESKENGS